VQLTDLLHHVSRLWTPPAKIPGRKVMVIPYIKDINNSLQAGTVAAQCQQCAKQLAGHLYVWRKPYPEKATVKNWSTETQSFVGMSIEDFANFLMANFTLRTADGKEWLLDRCIASLIWAACVEPGSPLPEASWQIGIDRKRLEARK
jgi:hypothetical protein